MGVVRGAEAAGIHREQVVAAIGRIEQHVRVAGSAQGGCAVEFHRDFSPRFTRHAQIHRAPILRRHLEAVRAGIDRDAGLVQAPADVGQGVAGAPAIEVAAHEGLHREGGGIGDR